MTVPPCHTLSLHNPCLENISGLFCTTKIDRLNVQHNRLVFSAQCATTFQHDLVLSDFVKDEVFQRLLARQNSLICVDELQQINCSIICLSRRHNSPLIFLH
jgi:hypothetical protein